MLGNISGDNIERITFFLAPRPHCVQKTIIMFLRLITKFGAKVDNTLIKLIANFIE